MKVEKLLIGQEGSCELSDPDKRARIVPAVARIAGEMEDAAPPQLEEGENKE